MIDDACCASTYPTVSFVLRYDHHTFAPPPSSSATISHWQELSLFRSYYTATLMSRQFLSMLPSMLVWIVMTHLLLIVGRSSMMMTSAFAPVRQRPQSQRAGRMTISGSISTLKLQMLPPEYSLDPKSTAFVFIEYQNEFTTPGGKLHDAVKDCMEKTNMMENSSKVADFARSNGCTIIHCPINFEKGHAEIASEPYGILAGVKEGAAFTNGEWGAEFASTMKPAPGDLVVKGKSGLCGFESTNLDFLLRQKGAQNVVLAGFLTNCCVESTMRSAYEKGYKVFTLKDCVAATSVEAQEATLQHNFGMFSIPTTSEEVMAAISAPIMN